MAAILSWPKLIFELDEPYEIEEVTKPTLINFITAAAAVVLYFTSYIRLICFKFQIFVDFCSFLLFNYLSMVFLHSSILTTIENTFKISHNYMNRVLKGYDCSFGAEISILFPKVCREFSYHTGNDHF